MAPPKVARLVSREPKPLALLRRFAALSIGDQLKFMSGALLIQGEYIEGSAPSADDAYKIVCGGRRRAAARRREFAKSEARAAARWGAGAAP